MRFPERAAHSTCLRRGLAAASAAAFVVSPAASHPAFAEFFWANPRPTGADLGGIDFESATVGYAVGEFATTLRTTDAGVSWEDLTDLEAFGPHLVDILVLAPGDLLAAGETPGLHRSTDGGLTWNPVSNPASAQLRNLFRLNASTLFAVGDAGRVIRSTNGGASWTLLGSPGGNIVDQWWLDASNGYVVGSSRARRTTDGGASWSTIPGVVEASSFFSGDVQFMDAQNGWIFLDFDTYRTTNGGASWAKLTMSFVNAPIYQEEAILFDAQTWLIATEAEGAGIWKTTDSGAHWTNSFEHNGTRGVTDVHRLPGGAIVAVTSDGDLLRSTDGGTTWANFTEVAGPETRENLNVMSVLPGGVGFAAGWGGAWLATTNGGRTWFNPPSNPGATATFAIHARDPQFILTGGSSPGQGDVRRSTDGGATWTVHSLAATYVGAPQGIIGFADGTCYCATYGGTNINFVFRSTDSGSTWHLRNNGVPASRMNDLFFLDSQSGFVCGGDFQSPLLYRTTDGGGQWTPVGTNGLLIGSIRDMHWFDLQNGLVCGDSRVQRTTDGGANWATVVLDSGASAMDFLDSTIGYVDAFTGGVHKTTDAGATWTFIAMPMADFIDDVVATPDGFLVASQSNAIFGWGDGTAVATAETSAPLAVNSAKLDVWPNPLRMSEARELSFRWAVLRDAAAPPVERIEARLVDVRGRLLHRVNTTLDESGRGILSLDGLRIAAGVAFLELRAPGGARVSRPVTLVR